MGPLLTQHRAGFEHGFTAVTKPGDPTGVALGVLKLASGEQLIVPAKNETAWLLMSGAVRVDTPGPGGELTRRSLFDDPPAALHVSAGTEVRLHAHEATELTVYETSNTAPFAVSLYLPGQVKDEHRGKGKVHDAAYRFVRTVFDGNNAPAAAELVLGEVVNFPGRWSSYPPHHHPQPELYHYRFDRPEGYGHAELGETVFKVKSFDTLRIMDGLDHPQCAAPGYAMYYAWVIRHLPGSRYDTPQFDETHKWTMEAGARGWWPRGVSEP